MFYLRIPKKISTKHKVFDRKGHPILCHLLVSFNTVGHLPVLFDIMLGDSGTFVVDVGQRVTRVASAVAVEEDFHGFLDELLGSGFIDRSFFRILAENRQSQVSSKACGDHVVGVRAATEVDVSEERLVVLHAPDDHVDPQRIEFRSTIVQDSREPSVQIFRLELNLVIAREVSQYCFIDELLEELEIGVVAGDSDDDVLVDLENSVDVVVSGQVAVGNKHISGDDHSFVVLDANNRCSSSDRSPKKVKNNNFSPR